MQAIAKLRSRSRVSSTTGSSWRHSHQIAIAIATTAITRKARDEMAIEPVVALAAIEHDFEAGEADRDERDTDTVDPQLAAAPRLTPFLGELRRVLNQPARKQQRHQSDRDVDEENPAPREVVGDPSAERRPDRRRRDDRHAVERESAAELLLGEGIDQDRLFHRRETAAANSLQHAEHDQHCKARRDAA